MNRTNELMAAPIPPMIMEYYSNIHLDIDVLFVNKIPFLLATSRDIGFIHCKAILSNTVSAYRMDYYKSFLTMKQGDSKLYP